MRDGARALSMMRWGMPSPAFALKGKKVDPGVTNVRNTASPHWRRWLSPPYRCLVPFTSFSENEKAADGSHPPVWFSLTEDRPLTCFAGILVEGWQSVRKVKDGETTDDLYAFLTTEPNAEVGAVHPKAMPVSPSSIRPLGRRSRDHAVTWQRGALKPSTDTRGAGSCRKRPHSDDVSCQSSGVTQVPMKAFRSGPSLSF
jgi:hypothetical protein